MKRMLLWVSLILYLYVLIVSGLSVYAYAADHPNWVTWGQTKIPMALSTAVCFFCVSFGGLVTKCVLLFNGGNNTESD